MSMLAIRCGRRLVVRCAAELSGDTAGMMEGLLRAAAGTPTVLLDLSRSPYLDSDGLRWLLALHQRLLERGANLRLLVGAGSRVQRTLTLSGCDRCLSLYLSGRSAWRGVAPRLN
jgi:anti-anti-sigma factor